MSALAARLIDVSFQYPAAPNPLFEALSLHFASGWTGVVGANGAGKSTLLQLLDSTEKPTFGSVRIEPAEARVIRCAQGVDLPDAWVQRMVTTFDGLARRLMSRLKLEPALLDRWSTLSFGERKRFQLAGALWAEPDVMLLDEPTNHLDAEAVRWVRGVLERFRGIGVLVSHDRALLDALTTSTVWLDSSGAHHVELPFTAAKQHWDEEDEQLRAQQHDTRRSLEASRRALQAQRQALQGASTARNTRRRMRDHNDSDARTLAAGFRAEMAEQAHAKTLRRIERKLEFTDDAHRALRVRDEAGGAFHFEWERCHRATVASAKAGLLRITATTRLWVRGPNGAGKSTLLHEIVASPEVQHQRTLVLPQDLTDEQVRDDRATLEEMPPVERGRVLQLVHALGVEPDQLLRSERWSHGEARKLHLALGLSRPTWLAVLDEPTNHLDVPSIERLERALAAYPGALVLVTHDERLGNTVCEEALELPAMVLGHTERQ